MRRCRVALLALLLVGATAEGRPQESADAAAAAEAFMLEAPEPNPFERRTEIAFTLDEALFRRTGRAVVHMRVYNLLHQLVGVPMLEGGEIRPRPLEGVVFTRPGRHVASWDGRDVEGRAVSSGPYFVELVVNGRSQVRKVLLVR